MLEFYIEIKVQSWCKIVTQHLLTACDINERGVTASASAATRVAAIAASTAATTQTVKSAFAWNEMELWTRSEHFEVRQMCDVCVVFQLSGYYSNSVNAMDKS